MNVMLFSRIVAKSGVGNHMKELSAELANKGHNVVIVSTTNEQEIESIGNLQFVLLNNLSLKPVAIRKNIRILRHIILENRIEVVHCHHRMAALYMRIYNAFYHIPVVYTLHLAGIPSDFLHKKMTFVGDKAIGVSTSVSEFMIDKLDVPSEKVVTILNGVDNKKLFPLSEEERIELGTKYFVGGSIQQDRIVIAMHSRIAEIKNHMLMVEAMHMLPKEIREKFIVLCSGECVGEYYNDVKKKIESLGLENTFRFLGWTKNRDILGMADVLILPSKEEGFPLSVVEAFFMKVLVVRTRTGGFDDQKYCIPISKKNPEDIVKVLTDIYDNGIEMHRERIEKAYKYAMEELTIEKMTEKTMEIYKEVL